jgi:hypothetical protein
MQKIHIIKHAQLSDPEKDELYSCINNATIHIIVNAKTNDVRIDSTFLYCKYMDLWENVNNEYDKVMSCGNDIRYLEKYKIDMEEKFLEQTKNFDEQVKIQKPSKDNILDIDRKLHDLSIKKYKISKECHKFAEIDRNNNDNTIKKICDKLYDEKKLPYISIENEIENLEKFKNQLIEKYDKELNVYMRYESDRITYENMLSSLKRKIEDSNILINELDKRHREHFDIYKQYDDMIILYLQMVKNNYFEHVLSLTNFDLQMFSKHHIFYLKYVVDRAFTKNAFDRFSEVYEVFNKDSNPYLITKAYEYSVWVH